MGAGASVDGGGHAAVAVALGRLRSALAAVAHSQRLSARSGCCARLRSALAARLRTRSCCALAAAQWTRSGCLHAAVAVALERLRSALAAAAHSQLLP